MKYAVWFHLHAPITQSGITLACLGTYRGWGLYVCCPRKFASRGEAKRAARRACTDNAKNVDNIKHVEIREHDKDGNIVSSRLFAPEVFLG